MSLLFNFRSHLSGSKTFDPRRSAAGILPRDHFRRLIEYERYRSGRNNHEFSLVLIAMDADAKHSARSVARLKKIARQLRQVDEVGWFDDQRIGILLPYTSREGASLLMSRICHDLEAECSETLECHIFSYPDKQVFGVEEDG